MFAPAIPWGKSKAAAERSAEMRKIRKSDGVGDIRDGHRLPCLQQAIGEQKPLLDDIGGKTRALRFEQSLKGSRRHADRVGCSDDGQVGVCDHRTNLGANLLEQGAAHGGPASLASVVIGAQRKRQQIDENAAGDHACGG